MYTMNFSHSMMHGMLHANHIYHEDLLIAGADLLGQLFAHAAIGGGYTV